MLRFDAGTRRIAMQFQPHTPFNKFSRGRNTTAQEKQAKNSSKTQGKCTKTNQQISEQPGLPEFGTGKYSWYCPKPNPSTGLLTGGWSFTVLHNQLEDDNLRPLDLASSDKRYPLELVAMPQQDRSPKPLVFIRDLDEIYGLGGSIS